MPSESVRSVSVSVSDPLPEPLPDPLPEPPPDPLLPDPLCPFSPIFPPRREHQPSLEDGFYVQRLERISRPFMAIDTTATGNRPDLLTPDRAEVKECLITKAQLIDATE